MTVNDSKRGCTNILSPNRIARCAVMKKLPIRKNIRLKDYNYSNRGYYFITLCVKDGHEMLGKVVGDGVLDVPSVQLSKYGMITAKHIFALNSHYAHLTIQNYVIMPNHVHLLVSVSCGTSRTPPPTRAGICVIGRGKKTLVPESFTLI